MNDAPAPPLPPSWAKRLWLAFTVEFAFAVVMAIGGISISEVYGIEFVFAPHIILILILIVNFLSAVYFSIIEAIERSILMRSIFENFFELLTRILTLDKIKQALAFIASCYSILFMFSIIYEITYFHALDIAVIAIPMSLTDRIQVSIYWIPHIIGILVVSYVILPTMMLSIEGALFSLSVKKFHDIKEFPMPYTIFLLLPYLIILSLYGYLYLCIFDISIMEFRSHMKESFLRLATFFCFFVVVAAYINYRMFSVKDPSRRAEKWDSPDRNKRTTQVIWAHTLWVIILLYFQWSIAPLYAESSAQCTRENMYTFNLINNTSKKAAIIRSFSNYFLICDCNNLTMEFLNSDEVRSIVKH